MKSQNICSTSSGTCERQYAHQTMQILCVLVIPSLGWGGAKQKYQGVQIAMKVGKLMQISEIQGVLHTLNAT